MLWRTPFDLGTSMQETTWIGGSELKASPKDVGQNLKKHGGDASVAPLAAMNTEQRSVDLSYRIRRHRNERVGVVPCGGVNSQPPKPAAPGT